MDKTPIINKIWANNPSLSDLAQKAGSGCGAALAALAKSATIRGGSYLSPEEWRVVSEWQGEQPMRAVAIATVRALHNLVIAGAGTREQQDAALDLAESLLNDMARKQTEQTQNGDEETK